MAVTTTAMTMHAPIPSRPMARPLNTEVRAKATPLAVPTRPLARSRPSSGTSRVTVVDSATERRLPAIAPARTSVMNAQKAGSPRSRSAEPGATRKTSAGQGEGHERQHAGQQHRRPAPMPVDVRPEDHRRQRDQQHVAAADDRRRQDRPGLEVDPEGQREPQEVVGDAGHERVRDQQVERPHPVTSMTELRRTRSGGGSRFGRRPATPSPAASDGRAGRSPAGVASS